MTASAAPSSLTKKLIKGGGISLIGNIVQAGLNIIFQWYMARTLGAAGVGVFTLGFSIVSIAMLFAMLGMERGIVKFLAHYTALGEPEKAHGVIISAFRIYGVFSVLVSLAISLGAEFINARFFQEPALVPVLRWMSIYLIAIGWVILLVNIPLAYLQVKYQVIVQRVFIPISSLLLAVLLVFFLDMGLMAFIYATVFSTIIAAVIAVWLIFRDSNFKKIRKLKPVFEPIQLISFSAPLFLAQLVNRTRGQTSFLLIGSLASLSDVGVYRVGSRITLPLSIMLMALLSIFSPIISTLFAENNLEELARLYRSTTRWLITFSMPFLLFIMILPGELLALFGDEFVSAVPVLRLIGIAQFVNVATGPVGMLLQMTKYAHVELFNGFLALLVIVVTGIAFIPKYGIIGAGIADLFAISLLNLLRLLQVYVKLKIHPFELAQLKPVAVGILAGIISYTSNYFLEGSIVRIPLVAIVILSVFLFGLWMMKIEETDKELFASGVQFLRTRIIKRKLN